MGDGRAEEQSETDKAKGKLQFHSHLTLMEHRFQSLEVQNLEVLTALWMQTVSFFKQQICPVPYHFLMSDKKLTYDITFKYVSESKSLCKLHICFKKSTTQTCFLEKETLKIPQF